MPLTSNQIIRTELADATNKAIDRSSASVTSHDKREIIDRVLTEATPVILNQTNNEPWFQSRVTIGLLVTALITILKPIIDWPFDEGQTTEIVNSLATLGQLGGLAYAYYGRWVARKPIGG